MSIVLDVHVNGSVACLCVLCVCVYVCACVRTMIVYVDFLCMDVSVHGFIILIFFTQHF